MCLGIDSSTASNEPFHTIIVDLGCPENMASLGDLKLGRWPWCTAHVSDHGLFWTCDTGRSHGVPRGLGLGTIWLVFTSQNIELSILCDYCCCTEIGALYITMIIAALKLSIFYDYCCSTETWCSLYYYNYCYFTDLLGRPRYLYQNSSFYDCFRSIFWAVSVNFQCSNCTWTQLGLFQCLPWRLWSFVLHL